MKHRLTPEKSDEIINDVVKAEPVKPKKRKIINREKGLLDEAEENIKSVDVIAKSLEVEKRASIAVMDKLDRIMGSTVSNEEKPFAKYDEILAQDKDDEDSGPRIILSAKNATTTVELASKATRGIKKKKYDVEGNFVIDDDSASISNLTKGNVWASDVNKIYNMLLEGRRTEHWTENEIHYMNIIRPVFDVEFINKSNEKLVASLENTGFKIFPYPTTPDDTTNGIAIRKHQIKKISDLTMENVLHLSPLEVLELIRDNLGTGWDGLPLTIQDIIETAFYVDSSTLPEAAMHRNGGIIDRRKADGYEVLEIHRGTWIEAVFLKYKPKIEKTHVELLSNQFHNKSVDDEEEEDVDDDLDDDIDETDNDDIDADDDDVSLEDQTPQIEDFEDLPDVGVEDEDE